MTPFDKYLNLIKLVRFHPGDFIERNSLFSFSEKLVNN